MHSPLPFKTCPVPKRMGSVYVPTYASSFSAMVSPLILCAEPSPVDGEHMAVHEIRGLGGEEYDGPKEVFQFAQALHRNPAEDPVALDGIVQLGGGDRRHREHRGDGVAVDALRPPLNGERARELLDGALAGRVSQVLR